MSGRAAEVDRLGSRTLEEARERLQVADEVRALLLRQLPLPAGHRGARHAHVDHVHDVGIRGQFAGRRRADLVVGRREVARTGQHPRRGRAVAGASLAMALRTPAVVHGLARMLRILRVSLAKPSCKIAAISRGYPVIVISLVTSVTLKDLLVLLSVP